MLILGIISFLQMVFIPGFILLRYVGFNPETGKSKGAKIRELVYGFGLSLLVNYLLVFLLTILGIYKPLTIYIVLLVEGVLIWYIIKKSPPGNFYLHVNFARIVSSIKHFITSHSLVYNLLLLLSFIIIFYYILIFFNFIDTAFVRWDPVHSWNRWAMDWANNHLPYTTFHYPQLIPANWSLSYVIMQNTDVHLFAKSIMAFFSIGTLLLFLHLGFKKENATYFLALVLYGVLLNIIYKTSFIVSGHMDIPVSFFAFLSFHVMHVHQGETGSRDFKTVWLAVLFASAAVVTKQAGIFILVFILVWAFRSIYKNRKAFSPRIKVRRAALLLLTVLIVSASWYTLNEIQIQGGRNPSEIRMVQNIQAKKRSFGERFIHGINQIFKGKVLTPLVYVILLLMFLGLLHKESRVVTLFVVIPYTLIWLFLFSYDVRNLALAVPFIAFSAAFGTIFLKKYLLNTQKNLHFKIPVIPVIILALLVITLLSFTLLKKETLIRQQNHQRLKLANDKLNELLYLYHERVGIKGKIATNYRSLRFLPVLWQFYRRINWCKPGKISLKFFKFFDTEKGKDIHYFLLREKQVSSKEIYGLLWRKMKKNEYRLIFKADGYQFVQVRR